MADERHKCDGYTPPNQLHQHKDGKWFFCDEIGYNEFGPFDTREQASTLLDQYTHWLETGERPTDPEALFNQQILLNVMSGRV